MNDPVAPQPRHAAPRRAPAEWPAARPAPEGVTRQPLREDANIQGNVLAGFNKDHQVLMFVSWPSRRTGQAWLTELRPRLASNRAVTDFNMAFSASKKARAGRDPDDLTAVWTNISFTAAGIKSLAPKIVASLQKTPSLDPGVALWLKDPWDKEVAARLGDTGDDGADNWLFGRTGERIHAVVCIAADLPRDLDAEIARFREEAERHRVRIVFEQHGETLPDDASGHEHFGFKDGISQPGVRGYDCPDPGNPDQVAGKPGTDLIAAGTFVLGYRRDSGKGITLPAEISVPRWMWDGSFLVTRRLAQDVPGFWANVEAVYRKLIANGVPERDLPGPDALAAKLVGRWRSGTPTAEAPTVDAQPALGPAENNRFTFKDDTGGVNTPFVAHIRKLYPREGGDGKHTRVRVSEEQTMGLRILRRGIPFGPAFAPSNGPGAGVDTERGLVFQCYQASLADQFVYLQQKFVNNPRFPNPRTGRDAVIGRDSQITVRFRRDEQHPRLGTFVRTQGSLFSFTPSLSTVDDLAAGRLLSEE
jgi:Dyp-type peroxidase family